MAFLRRGALVCVLVAAVVVLPLPSLGEGLPPGGTFVDDDGSVHEGDIEAIAAVKITLGCNPPANTRFCPKDKVTRGQMATFLARALHLTDDGGKNWFVDDDGHLFEGAINKLATGKITQGCNPPANDRFCPDGFVTRGQMAAFLSRAFGFQKGAGSNFFVDDDEHLFEAAIDRLAAAGVTRGCNPPTNDRFCPDNPVTRAEMATFLTRALGLTSNPPPPRRSPVVIVEPRTNWGARPAETEQMTRHTIERLTIHHAGTQSGVTGAPQYRGWQSWHMDGNGWPDIAYHLIIGVDGTVHEGRDPAYRGDTATTYDTTGHFLVVVEGNFDDEEPTAAQLESLVAVLAWASATYAVSPTTIAGHLDYAATVCPGRHLQKRIASGEIRDTVQTLLDQGGVDLIWP